jgi:hypothetical protein
MTNLARAIAEEAGVQPAEVMLLRFFATKLAAIKKVKAALEEFVLVQPAETAYDYRRANYVPVKVVVVITADKVRLVYRIGRLIEEGSNRVITSARFRELDSVMRYPERQVKRFAGKHLASQWLGHSVTGWTSPRVGVARVGGKLFDAVSVR